MSRSIHARTAFLVRTAKQLLGEEHPMTLRQLFYRLVSRESLENSRSDYQRLSRVMTRAREDGQVSFDLLVDRSRPNYEPNVFEDPEEYAETIKDGYRRNYWQWQPSYVEVWLEKDSVVGSIADVTEELGITTRVGRGFPSATRAKDIAELFAKTKKPKVVLYLGDHDPSGRCIEEELFDRVRKYGSGDFKMRRLAIHAGDIRRFGLPPLKVKDKDPRVGTYRKRYGEHCVELDALPPTELRRRVRRAIEGLLDRDAWQRAIDVEAIEVASIVDIASRFPTAKVYDEHV